MKNKTIALLLLLFLLINSTVYIITYLNEEQRIKLVLDDNLKTLQTYYEILLQTQKITALAMYKSTLNVDGFIEIMSQANHATKEKKALLRAKLYKILIAKYKIAQEKSILQYQFVLPNNESFLRMHKPDKFGDNLTDVRDDFKYVNKTKEPIRGFIQGRTTHGFRNTFPLFDANGLHIGAMEVSFSSDNFQWYLNHISHIHAHFLVNKSIFDAKTWVRDDMVLKYLTSSENKNYMITLGKIHTIKTCIEENKIKLRSVREVIDNKMLQGEKFSVYTKHFDHIDVSSFLPVKNLKNEAVSWLVSYEKSPFIESTLRISHIIRVITLLISILLIYFIVQQIHSKILIEKKHKLLDDILNITDNIMFVTDFKKVSYSNSKFKNLFSIKHTQNFNENTNNNVLSIFIKADSYLHRGLLKENEDFSTLIKRTSEEKRVVTIFDKYFEAKAFKISISKINIDNEYLVTLSDITKLKAQQIISEQKAYIDGLTGIYNRNKFDEVLDEEILSVKRYKHKFSMALIDIDKFKDFNDTYGHLIGDEVLIMLAQSLKENLRETDLLVRWGGEEFIILFKETSVEDARIVSQKLKDKIENLQHPMAGNITISFGLTQYKDEENVKSIFERCDKALYLAKENGRNRIEVL